MKRPRLIYFVGLPGSSKTKYAMQISKETGAEIVSSDRIRNNLLVINEEVSEDKVFNYLDSEVISVLKKGKDCIVDCTNIKSRRRKHFLNNTLKNVDCERICIIMGTPIKECKANLLKYGSDLPEDIVDLMYKGWQTPAHWEGWDKIWIHYDNPEWMTMNGTPENYIRDTIWYDQGNEHHSHSLGTHSSLVKDNVKQMLSMPGIWERNAKWNSINLLTAALLHDCGKPIAREEIDGKTTYHCHQNIGAYEAMFYKYNKDVDPVYVSNLVNYHMSPIFWQGTKARISAMRKWGRDFFEDIMLLYDADERGK